MRSIRAHEEDGFVLVIALGFIIVLTVLIVSTTNFTVLNLHSSDRDSSDANAAHYADAALQSAYAIIAAANTTGKNPAAANLLGCAGASSAADTNGPSTCTTPSPFVFCYTGVTSCTNGTVGSASVYGFFSGTGSATYNGTTVPASTWLLVSTGYAPDNPSPVVTRTKMAFVKISALSAGAVAAVWNHVFITAPLVSIQCSLSFGGNSVQITVPLYVVGIMCLGTGGSGATVYETTQPVDVQVGGKHLLSGGSKVGTDSQHGITSGVVSGGCTTVSVSSATTACDSGSYSYWVKKTDTWVANDAPGMSTSDMDSDYATFDPGPNNACKQGTTPSPLGSTTFDNNTTRNTSAASFELTPNSSYACISNSPGGTATGYLIWNNGFTTLTVSGISVPAKTLAINGSIFLDGNMTISQNATYTGSAVIETSGTITFNGNGTTV